MSRIVSTLLLALTGCAIIRGAAPYPAPVWSDAAKAQRQRDCWYEWENRHGTNVTQAEIEAAYADPCGALEREGRR